MTWVILIFTGVSIREKRRYRGFSWLGLHFFFLLVILGTGISGLDLEPTNDTHQPLNRPFGLLCVFPAFFLSSTKSRFHRGLLVYGVDDFTGCTWTKRKGPEISTKKKEKPLEFFYHLSGRPDIKLVNNATCLVSPSATSMRSD